MDSIITIDSTTSIDTEELAKKMVSMGFVRTAMVEGKGQFSIRGGIIDIFSYTDEAPVRIELWDTEVDSIRMFDAESQRSIEKLKSYHIFPATEYLFTAEEKQAGLDKIRKERDEQLQCFDYDKRRRTQEQIEAGNNINKIVGDVERTGSYDKFLDTIIKDTVGLAEYFPKESTLVVLDEPTNGLDPNQILEIRHLIKEIAEDCTVILSTHILSEIQATCSYIRMIGQGTLVFSGTVDEFDNYISPSTVFVTLVEAPPIEELQQIPGVVGVEELGGPNYRLRFSDLPQEVIEKVVKTSVVKDWRLTEIRMEKTSLDDVFAELSKKKN